MLEVVGKVVEAVIDTCIKTEVQFNDVLHGFCVGRGMGTAILEFKLTQELEIVYQEPLFLLLLYLSNAYNNLDRGPLLQTLDGVWGGTKQLGYPGEIFITPGGSHSLKRRPLPAVKRDTRDHTEGLASSMLFNVLLESMVRHWLSLTVEDESDVNEGIWMAMGRSLVGNVLF